VEARAAAGSEEAKAVAARDSVEAGLAVAEALVVVDGEEDWAAAGLEVVGLAAEDSAAQDSAAGLEAAAMEAVGWVAGWAAAAGWAVEGC